ncbi:hypothetical protein CEXT_631021 [Caerostris extrusa]|uniref:Uncharacterized protein n=1 Tax=Caerostris extrusa TaxID=172846 RepID=A0AAV4MXH6_CAEEX|nr:hypothetical protein CEXT_631021 [Caerostris extrusa]
MWLICNSSAYLASFAFDCHRVTFTDCHSRRMLIRHISCRTVSCVTVPTAGVLIPEGKMSPSLFTPFCCVEGSATHFVESALET